MVVLAAVAIEGSAAQVTGVHPPTRLPIVAVVVLLARIAHARTDLVVSWPLSVPTTGNVTRSNRRGISPPCLKLVIAPVIEPMPAVPSAASFAEINFQLRIGGKNADPSIGSTWVVNDILAGRVTLIPCPACLVR